MLVIKFLAVCKKTKIMGGVSKSMLLKSVNKKIENIETKFTVFSKFYNIDM